MLTTITQKGITKRLLVLVTLLMVTAVASYADSKVQFNIYGSGSVTMNGTTIYSSGKISCNSEDYVTATPAEGWKFDHFHHGEVNRSDNPAHFNWSSFTTVDVYFVEDDPAPTISVSTPAQWFTSETATVSGKYTNKNSVTSIKVNGSTAGVSYSGGNWSYKYTGAETKGTNLSIVITDSKGKTGSASYTLKVDRTKPEIGSVTFSGSTKAVVGDKTWIKMGSTDFKVYVDVLNETSGVKDFQVSTNGGAYVSVSNPYTLKTDKAGETGVQFKVFDNANLSSVTQSYYYYVDGTAPIVGSISFDGDTKYYDSETGLTWFQKDDATAKMGSTITDNESGIKDITFPGATYSGGNFALPTAETKIYSGDLVVEDNVTNKTTVPNVKYGVDGVKPALFTNVDEEHHISATDDHSGLKCIEYSFDNKNWTEYNEKDIEDLLVVGTIYVKAIDNVGNTSDIMELYSVDAMSLITKDDNMVIFALLNKQNTPIFNPSMENIDKNLYKNNPDLISLEIPEYIKNIGDNAFKDCNKLNTVFCFSETVPVVGSGAFDGIAPGALLFVLPNLEQDYEASAWSNFFDADHILPMTPPDGELWYMSVDGNEIELPQTAFKGAINEDESGYDVIGKIKFNSEIDRVPHFAFQNYNNLKTIFLSKSVKSVLSSGFRDCKNLERVITTNQLEEINEYAFDGCENLRNINFEEGLKEIDAFAFNNCKNLTSFTLPKTIEYVGSRAFYGCEGILYVDVLGENPEKINMTHETFKGLQENTPIYVVSDKLLPFEAYNYGKGINFQTKVECGLADGESRQSIFNHHNMIVPAGVQVFGAKWNGIDFDYSSPIPAGEIIEGGKGYIVVDGKTTGERSFVIATTSEEPTVSVDNDLTGTMEDATSAELMKYGKLYAVYPNKPEHLTEVTATDQKFVPYEAFALINDKGTSVKYFDFDNWYNGWATGVQTLYEPTANSEQPMFNLAGQAVGSDYKGIVIKNGKKYLNK